MDGHLRCVHRHIDDEPRDLLHKEIQESVAGTTLDPGRDTEILARIGAWALRRTLPSEALGALEGFSTSTNHALLLNNLPRPPAPPTPVHGFAAETELTVLNALHLGLIRLLGLTPYAVDYENQGKLIRNVVPNPDAAGTASSWGADSEFFWHTDNPHLSFGGPGVDPRAYVPRYLTFCVVRNAEEVPTEVMALDTALGRLPERVRDTLAEPVFEVAAPDSNDLADDGGRRVFGGAPLLEHDEDEGHRVRYDRGTTRALDGRAGAALEAWVDTLSEAPCWRPVLRPGQFLVFDNYRVVHRRGAFEPAPSHGARWLRRCYAS
ncbi:TauD/TfdA family dioxygenase [Actinomadura litoris]|uniref:TauD/TfdA family dioxygenase n=1 Tax=Actinomadura litoris TaxID=2678616 RepID=UPI001FA7C92E|nr:TauD/TfdA family dioxygenase [Actinomadura litoris]